MMSPVTMPLDGAVADWQISEACHCTWALANDLRKLSLGSQRICFCLSEYTYHALQSPVYLRVQVPTRLCILGNKGCILFTFVSQHQGQHLAQSLLPVNICEMIHERVNQPRVFKASRDRKKHAVFGVRQTLTRILVLLLASCVTLATHLPTLRLSFLFCKTRW